MYCDYQEGNCFKSECRQMDTAGFREGRESGDEIEKWYLRLKGLGAIHLSEMTPWQRWERDGELLIPTKQGVASRWLSGGFHLPFTCLSLCPSFS